MGGEELSMASGHMCIYYIMIMQYTCSILPRHLHRDRFPADNVGAESAKTC